MAAMRARSVGQLLNAAAKRQSDVPRRVMANLSMKPNSAQQPLPQTDWVPPRHTNNHVVNPYFHYPPTQPPPPPYHTLRARSSTTPGSTMNAGQTTQRTTPHLGGGYFLTYHDLELALERRGLSMLRFLLGIGAAVAAGTAFMWPRIKRWGAAEGAEVAAQSLQADELKVHAAALINALINEPSTTKNVEEAMKAAMSSLMKDPELKAELTQYMADVMADAMLWPKVLAKGNEYVDNVLNNEESIENATKYFSAAAQRTVADTEVQDAASRALWSSVKGIFIRSSPATTTKPPLDGATANENPADVKTEKADGETSTE